MVVADHGGYICRTVTACRPWYCPTAPSPTVLRACTPATYRHVLLIIPSNHSHKLLFVGWAGSAGVRADEAHKFRHFTTKSFAWLVTGCHFGREKSNSMTMAETKRAAPLGMRGFSSRTLVTGASGASTPVLSTTLPEHTAHGDALTTLV